MKIIETATTNAANLQHIIPESATSTLTYTFPQGTILRVWTSVSGDCKVSINGQATTVLTLDNYAAQVEIDISGRTVKDMLDITVRKEFSVLWQAYTRKTCAEQKRNILLDAKPILDPNRTGEKAVDSKGRAYYICQRPIRVTYDELVPESRTKSKTDPRLTTIYNIFNGDHERVQAFLTKHNRDLDKALAAIRALLG